MNRAFHIRCSIIIFSIVSIFTMLAARLIVVHYFRPAAVAANTHTKKQTTTILHAMRGHIVDRHDQTIARSIPHGELWIDTKYFHVIEYAIAALAWEKCMEHQDWSSLVIAKQKQKWKQEKKELGKIYDKPNAELRERYLSFAIDHVAPILKVKRDFLYQRVIDKVTKKISYFKIYTDLDEATCDELEAVIKSNKIVGLNVIKSSRREYTDELFAPYLIGHTQLPDPKNIKNPSGFPKDASGYQKEVGVAGIEGAENQRLAGTDGYRIYTSSPSGNLIGSTSGITQQPTHGSSVMLTIDMEIQNILQEELATSVKETNAQSGCIIVMEPHTGEILGMASYPTYSLKNVDPEIRNLAIQLMYEPGSLMKAISFAAAINDGKINRHTMFNCHYGSYKYGSTTLTEEHKFGTLSAESIMGHSSNIGTFLIAETIGDLKFHEYLTKFGFGETSGFDFKTEQAGVWQMSTMTKEYYSKTHGYNITVTPLQIACAYSAIANGGKLMTPRIIKSYIHPDGTVIEHKPNVRREVISKNAALQTRIGLMKPITAKCTGNKAAVPGYDVCGKTGTSEKLDSTTKTYSKTRKFCSFAGMLPALEPEFVCLVMIDEPNTISNTGGAVAAPVFSRVCLRVAKHLDIKPDPTKVPEVANQ